MTSADRQPDDEPEVRSQGADTPASDEDRGDAPRTPAPTDPRTPTDRPSTGRPSTGRPATGGGQLTPGGSPWRAGPTSSPRTEMPPGGAAADEQTKLVRKIGEGGYGEVWLVEYLGRLEAHKYLRHSDATREALREAINTRAVDHPNVVRVVDVIMREPDHANPDVGPIVRMEYVDGADLGTVVKEHGILPVARVVTIGIQIADALRATHERGIVHLDLKPSNVILRRDGDQVVVTDFGISAALRVTAGALRGGGGGTPFFMAPELHRPDGSGTPGSDIWSLGVTLYFLTTGAYPFPFESMPPEAAVAEPPRNPCPTYRHVAPEFWQIVRKMLVKDPDKRYASMAEVEQDLRQLAETVVCPACKERFAWDSVGTECPSPSCQDPRIAGLKQATQDRRQAETALAECRFDAAHAGFERSAAAYGEVADCAALAAEAEQLVAAVDELAQQHDAAVAQGRELLANGRLIDCTTHLHDAARMFSHSDALKRVRVDLRDALATLYRSTREQVHASIRARRFDQARELVARRDNVVHHEPSLRELEAALGKPPRTDFRGLYQEVDRKHQQYKKWTREGREAIEALAFDKARHAYALLEGEFPAEEFGEMLVRLGRAERCLELAEELEDDLLVELAHDPTLGQSRERLPLRTATEACEALVGDFPVAQYPVFERFALRLERLAAATTAMQQLADDALGQAKVAQEQHDIFREFELLSKVKDLILHSDLFDANTREQVRMRWRETQDLTKQVRELYDEGMLARKERDYARARDALRRVEELAPGSYEDVPPLLEEIEAAHAMAQQLSAELSEEFAHVESGQAMPDAIAESLIRAQQLIDTCDRRDSKHWLSETGRILALLLDERSRSLEQRGGDGLGPALTALRATMVPLVEVLRPQLLEQMLERSAELRRAVCQLFGQLRVTETGRLEDYLRGVGSVLDLMEAPPLPTLVAGAPPPAGSTHPCEQLGRAVEGVFARSSPAARSEHADLAQATCRRLEALCPPAVAPAVSAHAGELARLARQSRFWAIVSQVTAWARVAGIVVVGVAIVFFAGFFVRGVVAERPRIAALQSSLGLDAAAAADLNEWLFGAADGDEQYRRMRLVASWEQVAALPAAGPEREHAVAAARRCRSELELPPPPAIDRAFRAGLSASTALIEAGDDDARAAAEFAAREREFRATFALLDRWNPNALDSSMVDIDSALRSVREASADAARQFAGEVRSALVDAVVELVVEASAGKIEDYAALRDPLLTHILRTTRDFGLGSLAATAGDRPVHRAIIKTLNEDLLSDHGR